MASLIAPQPGALGDHYTKGLGSMNGTVQPTDYKCLEDIPATFGPAELAGIMGISRNKAYDLVNAPDFPKLRVGRRIVISKKHFTAWLDEKMQAQNPF